MLKDIKNNHNRFPKKLSHIPILRPILNLYLNLVAKWLIGVGLYQHVAHVLAIHTMNFKLKIWEICRSLNS